MANKKIRTPLGSLIWVKITGQGQLKYEAVDIRENYIFTAQAVMTKAQAEEFKAEVRAEYEENHKDDTYEYFGDSWLKPCLENGNEKDDNDVYVKAEDAQFFKATFTTPSYWKNKDTGEITDKEISVYDNVPKAIELDKEIGNGSIGVISGNMYYWKRKATKKDPAQDGIKLMLDTVQIVPSKFKEREGNHGFGAIEDEGFPVDEDSGHQAHPNDAGENTGDRVPM